MSTPTSQEPTAGEARSGPAQIVNPKRAAATGVPHGDSENSERTPVRAPDMLPPTHSSDSGPCRGRRGTVDSKNQCSVFDRRDRLCWYGELLARYLERTDRRVYALVRGADDHHASALRCSERCGALFGPANPYADRVVTFAAMSRRPGLGRGRSGPDCLRRRSARDRAQRGVRVVRARAGVGLPPAVNLDGTRRGRGRGFAERCRRAAVVLAVASRTSRPPIVAGEHARRFSEDELDVGQSLSERATSSPVRGGQCSIARSV